MAMATSASGSALLRSCETGRRRRGGGGGGGAAAPYSSLQASFSSSPLFRLQPSPQSKVSPQTRVSFSLQRAHAFSYGDVGTDLKILRKEEEEEVVEEEEEEVEEEEVGVEVEEKNVKEEEGMKEGQPQTQRIGYAVIKNLVLALILGKVVWRLTSTVTFWTCVRCFLETWPFPAAIPLGFCSFFLATDQTKKESERDRPWNRLVILLGSFTWLILIPLGFRNGYVRGWPILLFLVYMCFFLLASELPWPSNASEVLLLSSIFACHLLASLEGVQLYFAWNWMLPTRLAVCLLVLSLSLHCCAIWLLRESANKNPVDLVMCGPYKFIRHPMYASHILLFSGYCLALRAYWSMFLLLLASILYFDHRVKAEEESLQESSHGQYQAYKETVRYKYFPLVY